MVFTPSSMFRPPIALSPEQAYQLAAERVSKGDLAGAEELCSALLTAIPNHYLAAEMLGAIRERQGRQEDAIAAYGVAAKISPGQALPFTRQAIIRLRRAFGPPPPPRPADPLDVPRVSM